MYLACVCVCVQSKKLRKTSFKHVTSFELNIKDKLYILTSTID